MKKTAISILVLSALIFLVSTQITLFSIQPIGAVPEGKTIVMLRTSKTEFIDSADAMCEREVGKVSLLCRGMIMAALANKGTILFRLPYIDILYKISTGGKEYR